MTAADAADQQCRRGRLGPGRPLRGRRRPADRRRPRRRPRPRPGVRGGLPRQDRRGGGAGAGPACWPPSTELEGLSEQMDRPAVYAGLLHAAKTDDPRHGALLARTRERRTAINKHLIFFDLEWVKVPDDAAAQLLADARAGALPPLPRAEARLAAALPERAGGEDPRREGDHRPGGVRPALRGDRLVACGARSSTTARPRR